MDELARTWTPGRGWGSTVDEVAAALARDPFDCTAWCQLAMMLGDTHAPQLALIVCLYASTLDGDQHRVRAHLDLCLLDLGLGRATTRPVALRALGEPGTIDSDPDVLATWTAEHLVPFDGDAARAARHVLAIAVAKLAR